MFAAIILVHFAGAFILPPLFGVADRFSPSYHGLVFLALAAAALLVFGIVYTMCVILLEKPKPLGPYLWREFTTKLLTPERIALALPVLLLFPLFTTTFSYFKSVVPEFQPFSWDPRFAAWDQALHGGYQPWQLLQPILGHPLITSVINGVYHLWFGVTYGVVLWQMADNRRPRLRMQYLLTFLLMWVLLGNLAAILLSSAGPVYFGRVTGLDDPFAPLMAYLHSANEVAPVAALEVQDLLWTWYSGHVATPGAGISAMPSMHLAVVFSFVLLGFATSRMFGVIFSLFAVFIFIGSVHLGWHYAIDGYVGIIGTWLIWRLSGWLLDRPTIVRLLWGGPSSDTRTTENKLVSRSGDSCSR
ncbi:MAG: phosphatase PAP2 family protein [Dongiaceae bacterium]